jgi:hypothetical protein
MKDLFLGRLVGVAVAVAVASIGRYIRFQLDMLLIFLAGLLWLILFLVYIEEIKRLAVAPQLL